MPLRLDIGSVKTTITGLDNAFKSVAKSKAIIQGGTFLQNEIRQNMSLTDHSQADLTALDHPYARRHGRIRIHEDKPWLVHRQTGTLRSSLRRKTTRMKTASKVSIWVDRNIAPHAPYVILGTKFMLKRDVLWDTATDLRVRQQTMKIIVKILGQDLRSKAGVRFGSNSGSGEGI